MTSYAWRAWYKEASPAVIAWGTGSSAIRTAAPGSVAIAALPALAGQFGVAGVALSVGRRVTPFEDSRQIKRRRFRAAADQDESNILDVGRLLLDDNRKIRANQGPLHIHTHKIRPPVNSACFIDSGLDGQSAGLWFGYEEGLIGPDLGCHPSNRPTSKYVDRPGLRRHEIGAALIVESLGKA